MPRDDTPFRSDTDLTDRVAALVGAAIRRQTWIFLLDADERPLDIVIPMDGVPVVPGERDLAGMADRLRTVVETVGAASVVLVWERPGGPRLRLPEAEWVGGLHRAGLPIRAQLLASDEGVRLLDPDRDALAA